MRPRGASLRSTQTNGTTPRGGLCGDRVPGGVPRLDPSARGELHGAGLSTAAMLQEESCRDEEQSRHTPSMLWVHKQLMSVRIDDHHRVAGEERFGRHLALGRVLGRDEVGAIRVAGSQLGIGEGLCGRGHLAEVER